MKRYTKPQNIDKLLDWARTGDVVGHYYRAQPTEHGKPVALRGAHPWGEVRQGCACQECRAAAMGDHVASPQWLDAQAIVEATNKAKRKAALLFRRVTQHTVHFCLRHRNGQREYGSRLFVNGVPQAIAAW